ncbi:MAG: hypothetical protein ACK5XP_02845, partial [Sphingobacteriia bacterium]
MGVDFSNPNSPEAKTGSKMETLEGCSAAYDSQGNLLAYSDGSTVWDAVHNQVATNMGGGGSSTQSGVFVQDPGDCNRFYLFTASEVDDANPLDQIFYSTFLYQNSKFELENSAIAINNNATEKLTAIPHADGKSFWILAHEKNNNRYLAYLLSSTGLDINPIVSNVGNIQTQEDGYKGQLKASPQGDRIASLSEFLPDPMQSQVEIFSFNSATGILSNPQSFGLTYLNNGVTENISAYAAAFSPSGRYLYVTSRFAALRPIFQVDLQASTISAGIKEINLPNTTKTLPGNKVSRRKHTVNNLVIGPLGRIYFSSQITTDTSFSSGAGISAVDTLALGAILTPDEPANAMSFVCNPKLVVLNVKPTGVPEGIGPIKHSSLGVGLPNFFSGQFVSQTPTLGPDRPWCRWTDQNANEPTYPPTATNPTLAGPAGTGLSYRWWQDGNELISQTSRSLTITAPGTYVLEVRNGCDLTSRDTVTLTQYDQIGPFSLASSSEPRLCPGEVQAWAGPVGSFDYRWEW